MRFYGADYWQVLKWPLKTFWSLQRQITALRAEEDQRALAIASCTQSGEAAGRLQEQLKNELGEPVVKETTFDAKRFAELQQKFKDLR